MIQTSAVERNTHGGDLPGHQEPPRARLVALQDKELPGSAREQGLGSGPISEWGNGGGKFELLK